MFKFILLLSLALISQTHGRVTQKIVTKHLPTSLKGSLDLSNGDLKVFSGHVLNMIRDKCSIPADIIFKIQKFISKLVAETNPTARKGSNEKLNKLIETINTCAKEPQKTVVLYALDDLKGSDFEKINEKDLKVSLPGDKEKEPKEDEYKILTFTIETDDSEPIDDKTKPEAENVPKEIVIYEEEPFTGTTDSKTNKMDKTHSSFYRFFQKVFNHIRGFFTNAFYPNSTTLKRVLRSTSDSHSLEKRTFINLFDEICRIYCSCSSELMIKEFKLAARELLEFIYMEQEASNIISASDYLIDPVFMQNVTQCW